MYLCDWKNICICVYVVKYLIECVFHSIGLSIAHFMQTTGVFIFVC
jgi:hypothetical protein